MNQKYIPWLSTDNDEFPDVETAWKEPNGILVAGGDLSVNRLVNAYCHGIFPWYNEEEPILWWSPDPRCVLIPAEIKLSKSLRKAINKKKFKVTINQCFDDVVAACAAPRKALDDNQTGTWISDEMRQAYNKLHQAGYAHSVECWSGDKLVGGLYGLAIGKVFFGESMFSRETDASKVAFATFCEELIQKGFELIDGQVYSPHLETLGFQLIPRKEFIVRLNCLTADKEKLTVNT